MKTQELKIVPPKGYEVDWDNSSMGTIRFKPIEKKTTYKDICRELFLGRPSWRLRDTGVIGCVNCTSSANIHHSSISTSYKQLEQLLALNKLMNVAKYLNGDWEPDWNDRHQHKWFIFYDHQLSGLYLAIHYTQRFASVYFKSEELALKAIEILGEDEVKKALGILE